MAHYLDGAGVDLTLWVRLTHKAEAPRVPTMRAMA